MRLWSCALSVSGAFQTKRYRALSAGAPATFSGHTSTMCDTLLRTSKRVTMPPMLPVPDALDHTRLPSTVSGVAQPLSPPPTVRHIPRTIPGNVESPPVRALLGPIALGPSCRFPYTLYGILLSTVTWYICATGSCTWFHVRPRLVLIDTPPS